MSVIVSNEICIVVNKYLKKGIKLVFLISVLSGKKNFVKSNYNILFY